MKRQINSLNEAANYMYQFIEQINDVQKSILREDDAENIDLTLLEDVGGLCNKVIENISNQIGIIKEFEIYLEEKKEKEKQEKEKQNNKRRI